MFRTLTLVAAAIAASAGIARADTPGFLEGIKRHATVTQTVPANGDQNPYAIAVAPMSSGKLQKDDVLVTNFNDKNNLQGLGSTIVAYTPATKKLSTFAQIPRDLAGCPGGIGLTTALAVLKSGWVIAGSLPSHDGTTATKGPGCLVVLDNQGRVAKTIASPNINGPWGNMAVVDRGDTATLFVSNTGFGVEAPGQDVVPQATVVRIDLSVPTEAVPVVAKEVVVADGFGQQADRDVFIIGPTGLALGANGDLYVSDALGNRIAAIPDALTRRTSGGTGRTVTGGGLLKRPLAMTTAPNGHLLIMNGQNGQVVEVDPIAGKQIYARWIDANKAQTPPGAGDLFGIAMTPAGDGFYFVMDEVNALALAR